MYQPIIFTNFNIFKYCFINNGLVDKDGNKINIFGKQGEYTIIINDQYDENISYYSIPTFECVYILNQMCIYWDWQYKENLRF